MAVYGCLRALVAAVVAVTVTVGDNRQPSAFQYEGPQSRTGHDGVFNLLSTSW
jgi:hypothetical protein